MLISTVEPVTMKTFFSIRILPLVLLIAAALASGAATAALPTADASGQPLPTLAPVLKNATPAVVNISAKVRVRGNSPLLNDPFFRRFFDIPKPRRRHAESLGSGVIVDAELGYIITNHHVIDGAEKIRVTLHDGRHVDATLVGGDPESDIAVIQIQAIGLTALPLANSDELQVGDFVLAIGSPFGLNQTVTSGIVSALGRSGLGIEGYENFIQTDASINPGNSGGALINLRGEMVGINTAIVAPGGGNVGIGFAIPANMLRNAMVQLIEHGVVRHGQLGVGAQDLSVDLARAFGIEPGTGVVVTRVTPDSPAQAGGLQRGDVIVSIDGNQIRNTEGLRNTIGLLPVDRDIQLDVRRNRQQLSLAARLYSPEQQLLDGGTLSKHLAGARLAEIEVSARNGMQRFVTVTRVDNGSRANFSGLQPRDLILSANRQEINSLASLESAISSPDGQLLLNVQRGKQAFFLLLN